MMRKPDEREEEYFARIEFEKRKKAEQEKQTRLAEEERKRLREIHHMKCPKCGMELVEIGYRSIRIDRCTGCDGVWLDAGELEAVSRMEKSGLDRFFGIFKG